MRESAHQLWRYGRCITHKSNSNSCPLHFYHFNIQGGITILAACRPAIPTVVVTRNVTFIAITRHCVIDRRRELHSVQFAFCKVIIQIDMIGVIDLDRVNVGSIFLWNFGHFRRSTQLVETRDGTVSSLIPTSSMVCSFRACFVSTALVSSSALVGVVQVAI